MRCTVEIRGEVDTEAPTEAAWEHARARIAEMNPGLGARLAEMNPRLGGVR